MSLTDSRRNREEIESHFWNTIVPVARLARGGGHSFLDLRTWDRLPASCIDDSRYVPYPDGAMEMVSADSFDIIDFLATKWEGEGIPDAARLRTTLRELEGLVEYRSEETDGEISPNLYVMF